MDLGQEQEGLWGTQWAQEGTLTWAKAGRRDKEEKNNSL